MVVRVRHVLVCQKPPFPLVCKHTLFAEPPTLYERMMWLAPVSAPIKSRAEPRMVEYKGIKALKRFKWISKSVENYVRAFLVVIFEAGSPIMSS